MDALLAGKSNKSTSSAARRFADQSQIETEWDRSRQQTLTGAVFCCDGDRRSVQIACELVGSPTFNPRDVVRTERKRKFRADSGRVCSRPDLNVSDRINRGSIGLTVCSPCCRVFAFPFPTERKDRSPGEFRHPLAHGVTLNNPGTEALKRFVHHPFRVRSLCKRAPVYRVGAC